MIHTIRGLFDDAIKLQIYHPRIADVSIENYVAKSFKNNKAKTVQIPFYICHPKALKMKVLFADDSIAIWTFEPGKDPIPVKKIFASPVPLIVENGDVTTDEVTLIQIGY